MKIEPCRKCAAKMVWLYTKNQKPIPVDAGTVKEGDVEFDASRHRSHFASCAFVREFRKPKEHKPEKPAPEEKHATLQQGNLL